MKSVPVTRGFNNQDVIGELRLLDGVDVPIASVFALGGIAKKAHQEKDGRQVIDEFELVEISLIPDDQFIPYKSL